MKTFVIAVVVGLALAEALQACSLCDPNFLQKPTLRQSARQARFVVLGTLANARLDGERGLTDLTIERVVIDDGGLGRQKTLTLPTYVPFDAKNPPRFLVFGERNGGKISILRGSPVQGAAAADYLAASLRIDDRDIERLLKFCFERLDHPDPDVAADAFHEFARASDADIVRSARLLSPDKFRKLVKDPRTPAERVNLFAYLLGACGTRDDGDYLIGLARRVEERGNPALSGILDGIIEMRRADGWALVVEILRDPRRHLADKLAAVNTIRFFQQVKAKEHREQIVAAHAAVVEIGDLADMAIEDLRRWGYWEKTELVLAQYNKPSHSAPLVRRAIVRYAICCPEKVAADFVAQRRRTDADLVKAVEETLEFEKPSPPLPKKQP